MKALFVSVAFAVAALVSHAAYADAPAGSTALCKDGTYYSGKSKRGACSGHEGIKDWYGEKAATPATTTAPAATAATPAATADTAATPKKHKKKKDADDTAATSTSATPAATAPAAASTTAAATTGTKHKAPTPAKDIVQKPGGGAGLVWVNSSTKVYHCNGDEWYGKTKEGSYMTEAAAKSAGAHGSGNKDCAK